MDEELEVADLEKTAAREAIVVALVREEQGRAALVKEIVDTLEAVYVVFAENPGTEGKAIPLADWVTDRWQEQYADERKYQDMNDDTYYGGLREVMRAAVSELVLIWERG